MDWPTALLAICIVLVSGVVMCVALVARSADKAKYGDDK